MKEYISKENAVKTAWMVLEGIGFARSKNPKFANALESVYATCPAADVVEVRHGRWGEYESYPLTPSLNGYPCMACGQHEQRTTNYCPTCGAKMDKEE